MASSPRPAGSYVSSGQVLESPPLSARFNRAVDNVYNFFGLYFVSLLSFDPYTAAQNSQFNTASQGPNAYQNRSRWGGNTNAARPSGGSGSGSGNGSSRPGGSGGSGGRRMGTVDDVRGPECGSCG